MLNPELAPWLLYLRKQSMQLASKMRFISAQLLALLEGDLWLRAAGHANAMAGAVGQGVREVGAGHAGRCRPTASSRSFPRRGEELQREFKFYVWNEFTGEVRWMCSWDTTEEDVDAFVAAVKGVVGPRCSEGHEHRGYEAPIGLTVDPVVFTLLDGRLCVLLARRLEEPQRGMFALPGGFVGARRPPSETAERKLREKTGSAACTSSSCARTRTHA